MTSEMPNIEESFTLSLPDIQPIRSRVGNTKTALKFIFLYFNGKLALEIQKLNKWCYNHLAPKLMRTVRLTKPVNEATLL